MTKHLEQCIEATQNYVSSLEKQYGIAGVVNDFYKNFRYIASDPDMVIAEYIIFQRKAETGSERDSYMYDDICGVIYDWAAENLKGRYLKRFIREAVKI